MLVLNIRGQARVGGGVPVARPGDDGETHRWFAYHPNSDELAIVREAIEVLRNRVLGNEAVLNACNARFERLGLRTSFANLVDGATPIVVISRNFEHRLDYFGVTAGRHISIAQFCFSRQPRETAVITTAATLVHELAHVAGSWGEHSFHAEAAVRDCGFPDQFVPGLTGELTIPQLQHALRSVA